jgi:hypothetical protein
MESTGCSSHGEACPLGASALPASLKVGASITSSPRAIAAGALLCAAFYGERELEVGIRRGRALRQQGQKKQSRNFSPWSFLAKMGPIKWFCPTSRASHSEPQQLMQQAKLTTAPSDANQSPVRPDSGMRLHRTPGPRHKKWSPHCLQNRLTEDFGWKEILSVSPQRAAKRSCAAGQL